MVKRGGWKHSPETKARLSVMMLSRRAEISQQTKLRMAAPEVRRRIREGMKAASARGAEMQALQMAWLAASPTARVKFLAELTRADFDLAEPVADELGGG
jgi:hypothetical protein